MGGRRRNRQCESAQEVAGGAVSRNGGKQCRRKRAQGGAVRPTLIIARNFLRQMRWILLIYPLVAIAFAVTLVMANDRIARDDLDFYFVQQFVYAIGIATFLAGQANYNERKSRRILGVLSKGIKRRDYLAGLLGGVFASSAVFLAG